LKGGRRILTWLWILGIALFVYIVSRLDLRNVVANIKDFNLAWLPVYAIAFLSSAIFKALRWRTVLLHQSIPVGFSKALRITLVTGMWGVLTPGKAGEIAKIAYLDYPQLSLTRRLVSVVLDRLYDVIFLGLFGAVGLLYFLDTFAGVSSSEIGVALLVLATAFLFVRYRHVASGYLRRILRLICSPTVYSLIAKEWEVFAAEWSGALTPTLATMSCYSVFVYFSYFTQVFAVAKGYRVEVPFIYLAMCASLSALVTLVPITVGGVGTREGVFIVLLGKVAVPKETAALISFSDGVVLALFFTVASALCVSLYSRVSNSNSRRASNKDKDEKS
jgi:uncharacterized protein (TIRG00374 family)